MSESEKAREQFDAFLAHCYQEMIKSPTALRSIRMAGWKRFTELGLPTQQSESFKAVRLSRLFTQKHQLTISGEEYDKNQIVPHIHPECSKSVLVFVNGHYQPSLSNREALPDSIVVLPLDKAILTYGIFLNQQWGKILKEERDPFVALNTALHSDGLFVYLPPNTIVEAPVQILHFITAQEKILLLMPYFHICVGANAEIRLRNTVISHQEGRYFFNQVCNFTVEDNAHVKYAQMSEGGLESWHFESVRVIQKRDSTFKSVYTTHGTNVIRYDYRVILAGEQSEASLNGLWMLDSKLEAHTHVLIDHQAPACRSMQLFKGVLDDFSRSSFEGKIMVRQEAQKTDAFQLNNNLLLSDRADAASKPNLEVFADDVKASHGATIGQLDKHQLFYLKTRGLSQNEARKFLVDAFCKEVTDLLKKV